MSDYHIPVLLQECVDALNILPDGRYIDATYGAGGHSMPILKKLSAKGHLYGFDKDGDVLSNLPKSDSFTFIKSDYRYISKFMRYYQVSGLDGILADLGISSHQIDIPERGFSFRFDAELDMRMNTAQKLTARHILKSYSEADLTRLFSEYGEVRNSKTLASKIITYRRVKDIVTTTDLNFILNTCLMGQQQSKYFAQVYQALRIEVNDELNSLKEFLIEGTKLLKPGGRFVIITYHSLEDRLVKNLFRTGNTDGKVEKDEFGNIDRLFDLLHKDVILPSEEELKNNPRSRSAKLRIGIKK
jgi:16S rRNA (cytosine1402-N4)-methyltransferase